MAITCINCPGKVGRALLSVLLSALTLLGAPARAEKTISYYTDHVVERLDRVLACRDGAEDPLSLGCRNANAAQQMDVQLATRHQESLALKKWAAESDSDRRQLLVIRALENLRNGLMNVACINLTSGQPPTNPLTQNSQKVALEERFIQPVPGQPGKYKTTARGEEMLRAQQQSSNRGYFCPTSLQFGADFKITEFQDLTAKNKGKKTESGKVVKSMAVASVDLNLANTSSSVWCAKKVYSSTSPATGLAKARFLIVQFTEGDSVVSAGGILSVDGKTISDFNVEQVIEKYYK